MSGLISGVAGIFGGASKSSANKKATAAELAAQQDVRNTINQNLATTTSQIKPYYDTGTTALTNLASIADNYKPFDQSDLPEDDGYQFRIAQGQKALDANASRAGSVFSGAQLKAASDYNQDAASQEYQSAYNRYNTDQATRYNEQAGLAGIGQTATGELVAANQAATTGLTNSLSTSGQAQAQGYSNQGTISANMINSGAKALTSLASIFI